MGLVIERTKQGSVHASFEILFKFCGEKVLFKVKQYSPFVTNFEIVKRGNVKQKTRMTWYLKRLAENDTLLNPVIKGKYVPQKRSGNAQNKSSTFFDKNENQK